MGMKYVHKSFSTEFTAIHSCNNMKNLQGVKVVKITALSGWFMVDEGVIVEGTNGSCYGTGILNCPFCGEKL